MRQLKVGLCLAAVLGALVWMYNAMPDQRPLIIFSAIIGVGMRRR